MDQAKHYICRSCLTSVPRGHKFCGRCGEPVPDAVSNFSTRYFSDMQDPAKARIILVHGQGMDGLSYHLKADQHIVGRNGQVEFPDDVFVSPTHANFFYRNNKLVVRDEGSLNGVYLRVRGSASIAAGDTFMAGNHVLRLDLTPRASDATDGDGTAFYSSPKRPTSFRLSEVFAGGAFGITVCATASRLQVGRENSDLNFPGDAQMDSAHCSVEEQGGKFTLVDHDTKNGTYLRIKAEVELGHGDYLFVGKKLLRVELNA
jgi:predicted component of type VI protein secretion system